MASFHLAVAETDASGNYVTAWRVPLVTYGKNTNQAEALIGDAVASVVQYAREVGKPIVIEKLDFRQKKAALEGQSRRYSRMLSSFSYGKIKAYFLSRGYRQGVEIYQVNPAYSSVIGRVKFMERYGLTVHQAAALVLARRSLGFSEHIPRRWVCPVGNGVQVAFTVPVRKRAAVSCVLPSIRFCLNSLVCRSVINGTSVPNDYPISTGKIVVVTGRTNCEARLDVLGCDLGAAETGACSATPAGEAETPTQSGSGCSVGGGPRGGLSGDQLGVPG